MPNMLHSGDLIASIQTDLADNNAGLISALDVRHNLEDVAFSVHHMIASGDTNETFPFFSGVRSSKADATAAGGSALTNSNPTNGDFIAESGIFFPNCDIVSLQGVRQTEPWPGVGEIDHGELKAASLIAPNDDHTQYYHLDGRRALAGNVTVTQNYWINASGTNDTGLKFVVDSATDATNQTILVSGYQGRDEAGKGTDGGFKFMDNSIIPNGKGMAKAWLSLNTSGTHAGQDDRPVLKSYHNISGVQRDGEGKLTITFTSGTFDNNDYVAIGTANGRNTGSGPTNFEVNTVGTTQRQGDDGTSLRTCSVYILDADGSYQDSTHLDLVFFGYSPLDTSGTHPTISRA